MVFSVFVVGVLLRRHVSYWCIATLATLALFAGLSLVMNLQLNNACHSDRLQRLLASGARENSTASSSAVLELRA